MTSRSNLASKSNSVSPFSMTKVFLGLIILLSLLGLFFVFEASTVESFKLFGHQYYFFKQQAIWLLLSFVVLLFTSKLKVKFFKKFALHFYLLAILLLILTLIPSIGLKLNGTRRWIALPFGIGTLQSVEVFKFVLVNFYAYLLSKKLDLSSFLFFLFWPIVLVLLQPDFGSLMILVATSIIMYFLAGGRIKFLAILFAGGIVFVLSVILFSPYRRERLTTFLNPQVNIQEESYHVRQITLALGGGSWFGRGIGNSQQKYSYVPEASSDSIFAIVAEEIGFVGSFLIICLFILYFRVANLLVKNKVLTKYEYLLYYGILTWIAIQLLFNLSAVVVLLPLSGMPLPFFSQGGSSLVMLFFANGVLLSIATHAKLKTVTR
ncbi:MAG TPA: FtsW/RodA/SpoVE family cell cycle protein [Candidatus Woesebacteria bacterium]|nr:FtsW/RodA/SpoVE family cell cycle protein [Candidatus Woesebacteria bacterium]